MKFSHIADCHIGSWRDEKLNDLSTQAFIKALDVSMEEKVDFILIAGDIFNTSLPAIDKLKAATKKLKEVKDTNIPVYIIPGSHDFSPSGKTMLDVLEHAGLFINVVKGEVTEDNKLRLRWTVDAKTGAKITGILGKKGSLEKKYYEQLDLANIENETGFKIFMFHTALQELKPKELEKMEATPVSFLPKACNYYAGGHVHIVKHASFDNYQNIVYPGPLFPNSFSELEKLKNGGFYIYNNGTLTYKHIVLYPLQSITIHANHESTAIIQKKLIEQLETIDAQNAIVTIRIDGEIVEGKTTDIDFKRVQKLLQEKGAYFVMKNIAGLRTSSFEEIRIQADSTEAIEQKLIKEHCGQFVNTALDKEAQQQLTDMLLTFLNTEKQEGERVVDFEERIRKEAENVLNMKL